MAGATSRYVYNPDFPEKPNIFPQIHTISVLAIQQEPATTNDAKYMYPNSIRFNWAPNTYTPIFTLYRSDGIPLASSSALSQPPLPHTTGTPCPSVLHLYTPKTHTMCSPSLTRSFYLTYTALNASYLSLPIATLDVCADSSNNKIRATSQSPKDKHKC